MKFAHFADCHIGAWREPRLAEATTKAFSKAVDMCIQKKVDFVIIAGDLFNTSLPAIDRLKEAVLKLKELNDSGIPVYAVAGSHDFSASGKTIIDVLENAGLLTNVMKGEIVDNKLKLNFVTDPKTGVKFAGMIGKKGTLEKKDYETLAKENLEAETGFKIFVFHTALSEFKPEELEMIESASIATLPKNFNYYAGGHVHYVFAKEEKGYGAVTYPGPLFPNSFSELEKLENGGFYLVEENNGKLNIEWQPIVVHNVFKINIDCTDKSTEGVELTILEKINDQEFNNTIVTIRLSGTLKSGKVSDINFKKIFDELYGRSCHFVMKNTSALSTKELGELKTTKSSVEEIEAELIKEAAKKSENSENLTKQLMTLLDREKGDEKTADFEKRIKEEVSHLLGL